MKITLFSMLILLAYPICAQVGVGTDSPQATLHIQSGSANTSADGVIAPHLSKLMLASKVSGTYGSNQVGAIVFVNDVAGTIAGQSVNQTANITEPGYYFFDGNLWQPFAKLQSVTASSPITADTQNGIATIGINRKNMGTATGISTATTPITISGGNQNSVVGSSDVTIAVNNQSPLFNANKIQGIDVAVPTTGTLLDGQTLTYDDVTGRWGYEYPALRAIAGSFPSTGVYCPNTTGTGTTRSSTVYTGASIRLPVGKWMIHVGSTVGTSGTRVLGNGLIYATFWIGDRNNFTNESGNHTTSHIPTYSGIRAGAGLIPFASYKTFVSGSYAVEVKSDDPLLDASGYRPFYIYMTQEKEGNTTDIPNNVNVGSAFSSGAWERYLYVIPIQ
jgi:hypothetical protein